MDKIKIALMISVCFVSCDNIYLEAIIFATDKRPYPSSWCSRNVKVESRQNGLCKVKMNYVDRWVKMCTVDCYVKPDTKQSTKEQTWAN